MKKLIVLLLVSLMGTLLSSKQLEIVSAVGQAVIGVNHSPSQVFKAGVLYNLGNMESKKELAENLPTEYRLEQNYPNPFNPITTIKFLLPKEEIVKLTIINSLGKEVATLVNDKLAGGCHLVKFDAHNFASGQYFYKMNAGSFTKIRKMLLVK